MKVIYFSFWNCSQSACNQIEIKFDSGLPNGGISLFFLIQGRLAFTKVTHRYIPSTYYEYLVYILGHQMTFVCFSGLANISSFLTFMLIKILVWTKF